MIEINRRYVVCDECPMIGGLEYRLMVADYYGREPQLDHCGCDKIDCEFWADMFCEDAFYEQPVEKKRGKRRTGRAYRRYQAKLKNNKRRNIIARSGYSPTIGWIEYGFVNGKWQPVGDHVKYPSNSYRQRTLKRQSNKKVRRYKGQMPSGNSYRKIFDYWWTLY